MPNNPDDFNFNKPNKPEGNDDFVGSSFAVQFKPGDKAESVADKLKESKENIDKTANAAKSNFEYSSDHDSFMDEFDKFEYDSSITAFKPYRAPEEPVASKPAEPKPFDPKPAEPKPFEPKPAETKPAVNTSEPVFPKNGGTFDRPAPSPKAPEPPKEAFPKFNDSDSAKEKPVTKPGSEKIFNSGKGLDYATSEHDRKTSPFVNAEIPEPPKPINVDIPGTAKPAAPVVNKEPAKPVAPVNRPAAPASGYRPYPSANKTDVFTTPTQAAQAAQAAMEAEEAAAVKSDALRPFTPTPPAASKPAEASKPSQPFNPAANVIPEKRADMVKPAAKPAEPAKPSTPFASAAPAAPTRPAASAKPAEPVKPAAPAASPAPTRPAASTKPAEPVKPAAPAASPAPTRPAASAKPAEPVKSNTAAVAATAAVASVAHKAPAAPSAPSKPTEQVRPAAQKIDTVKAPAEGEKPLQRPAAAATPKTNEAPKAAPAPVKPAPAPAPGPSSFKPAPAPGPTKTEVHTEQAHRPGTVQNQPAPVNSPASPFEPRGKQPVAATRGVMNPNPAPAPAPAAPAHHDNKTISPVTTVKKTKKKKEPKATKDPGLAGLITFLAIIIIAIGVLWALDNTGIIKNIFGKKTIETIATVSSEVAAPSEDVTVVTTVTEETTTTAATTTTEATTETTTEATTTTTEETTTEETTEETTEATTERTRQTTKDKSAGECVTNFSTNITNFSTTAEGFKFDIELTNKSRKLASLPKSLKALNINIFCDSTITDVTADGWSFTGDGEAYKAVPEDITVEPGDMYTVTVYVSTSSYVSLYGYNYAFFDWNK